MERKNIVRWLLGLSAIFILLYLVFWPGVYPQITNYPPRDGGIVAFGDSLVYGTGGAAGCDFVSLLAEKAEEPIGDTFSVHVNIESVGQAINAASGAISFPRDKLDVVSVSKQGSIFSLWPMEPSFSNSMGTVSFEGIMLNPGYIGVNGKILAITFRVRSVGQANVSFSSGSILANDGVGTNILNSLRIAVFMLTDAREASPNNASGVTPTTRSDKVGNVRDGSAGSAIEAIDVPVITHYPNEIESGDTVSIRGTTYPDSDVSIYNSRR